VNPNRETRSAMLRVFSFWILMGLTCGQLVVLALAALLRASNPTGAPGRIGYAPPSLSIEAFTGLTRLVTFAGVAAALLMAFWWWRAQKRAEWSWSVGVFGLLVPIEIAPGFLARDMWMVVF
jgi:hypothetical protein